MRVAIAATLFVSIRASIKRQLNRRRVRNSMQARAARATGRLRRCETAERAGAREGAARDCRPSQGRAAPNSGEATRHPHRNEYPYDPAAHGLSTALLQEMGRAL